MRFLLIFAMAAVITGCADSHNWAPQQNGSARITSADRIYISTPTDGEYGDHVYDGSGRITSKIISNALSAKTRLIRIGGVATNFEDALAQAQRTDQDILVFPSILHWEDMATEW